MATNIPQPRTNSIKIKKRSKVSLKVLVPIILLVAVVGIVTARFMFAASATLINPITFERGTWFFPSKNGGYTEQSVKVKFGSDGSSDGYFAAMGGFLGSNNTPLYIGLQNHGQTPQGKIAVFSIWDATAAQSPQYAAPFGGEGVGYSARISYQWVTGETYKFIVKKLEASSSGDWWGAYIINSAGASTFVGKIKAPAGAGNLGRQVATFQERYSGPLNSCKAMKLSAVSFTYARSNGDVVSQSRSMTSGPACEGYHGSTDVTGGYTSVVGKVDFPGGEATAENPPSDQKRIDAINQSLKLGASNSHCPEEYLTKKANGVSACKISLNKGYFSSIKIPGDFTKPTEFCWRINKDGDEPAITRLQLNVNGQLVQSKVSIEKAVQSYCLTIPTKAANTTIEPYSTAQATLGTVMVYGAELRLKR